MPGKRRAAGPAVTKKPVKPTRTRKQKFLRVGKWVGIVGLVCVVLAAGSFVFLYQTIDVPDPNEDFQTETSYVYYNGGKSELGRFARQNRDSIPLDEMPQSIQDAVVAAENQSFWTDKGIDPKGIVRAAFSNARGNATQGASTITQQYVKILYLTQDRSLDRKAKEAILSLKLQRQMSKKEILEGYLNTIYFGRGAYGIQAASRAYFDINANKLSLKQSAVLASVLNNPTSLDPANGKDAKENLKERYDYVVASMAKTGAISAEEADRAAKRLPKFPKIEAQSTYGGQKGHMLKLVRDELHRLGFKDEEIDGGGLRVTTTFTKKAMKAAEDGVKEARPDGFSDKNLHVGVASVEPGTGALRGFYGGQDYLKSQINWAVAGGMVGSTFKPFTAGDRAQGGLLPQGHLRRQLAVRVPRRADRPQRGIRLRRARQRLRVVGQRDLRARAVDQHRVRRHVEQHPRRPRQDPQDGERARASRRRRATPTRPASRRRAATSTPTR